MRSAGRCTIALSIKTGRPSFPTGSRALKQLKKHGDALSNIEITDANIGAFRPCAKKYDVDFTLRKDKTTRPPHNLPYLIFVYLFGKVGQAYRLAAGAGLSKKLLHFLDGLTAAFANPAPSFHPIDLLIGLAGAVVVRLVIYCKGKNAKKYRKGMEYGSARWGTRQTSSLISTRIFSITSC